MKRNLRSHDIWVSPLDKAKIFIEKDEDPPDLCMDYFGRKGRGVKTLKRFKKGDFLVQYAGELISAEEGEAREAEMSSGYRFFYQSKGKKLCVDGTKETLRLGRLVNHGHKHERNCVMKQVHSTLCLFCSRDIEEGEELLYNYGVKDLPWEKEKSSIITNEFTPEAVGSTCQAIQFPPEAIRPTTEAEKVKGLTIEVEKSTLKVEGLTEAEESTFEAERLTKEIEESTLEVEGLAKEAEESALEVEGLAKEAEESTLEVEGLAKEAEESNLEVEGLTKEAEESTLGVEGLTEAEEPTLGVEGLAKEAEESNLEVEGLTKEAEESTLGVEGLTEADESTLEVEGLTKEVEESTTGVHGLTKGTKESTLEVEGLTKEAEKSTVEVNIGSASSKLVSHRSVFKASVIIITKTGEDGQAFPLTSRTCFIGRSRNCDIIVNSSSLDVECKLLLEEKKIYLKDMKKDDARWRCMRNNSIFSVSDRNFKLRIHDSSSNDIEWLPTDSESENSSEEMLSEAEDSSSNDIEWLPTDSESEDSSEEMLSEAEDYQNSEGEDVEIPSSVSEVEDIDAEIAVKMPDYQNREGEDVEIPPSVSEVEDMDAEIAVKMPESATSVMSEVIPVKNIIIQQANHNNNRRSEKLHSCLYCRKMYARISRHYTQVHSEEIEVAKILSLPRKSKQRKGLWAKIVNKGNFNHNIEVIEKQQGMVIPKYRPRENQDLTTRYVPCEYCLGMFVPSDLWKHAIKCRGKAQKGRAGYGQMVQNGKLLLPTVGSNQLYENILIKMRNDSVTKAVENDELILLFGERMYDKNGHNIHQHQYISQRLRELGRFLIQIREMYPTSSFTLSSCLLPCNWEKLLMGVRGVAGYNEETHVYDIPSLPLKLGHSLSKCAKILKMQGVKQDDDNMLKKAEGFLALYESEWAERISCHALICLHDSKFNKPQYVPLAEDVKKLTVYLQKEAEVLKEAVIGDLEHLDDFTEVILAQIILFNRKRSGEIQRMEVKDFRKSTKENGVPVDEEVLKSLSKFEKELCAIHCRIEIRGKRGRKVPVLLTEEMKSSIELMLKKRSFTHKYLFIKKDSTMPIRGCDVLRKFSSVCGAQHPHNLTSTRLRKHLATMSQILGLKDEHQDILARFMGHDIRIHREFYRLPESVLEMAKVSKVLHLINSGSISAYKGQDFDQIEFDNEELINDQDDTDEEDDEDDENQIVDEDEIEHFPPPPKKMKTDPRRRAWSPTEKAALQRVFDVHIKTMKVPGKLDCLNAMKKEKCLAVYNWKKIKYGIYNIIQARKKFV